MGGGAAPADEDYSQAPARQASGGAAAARPASRPAPNFSDMDDDIPF